MQNKNYRFYDIVKDMNFVELLNFMHEINNTDLFNVGYSSMGNSLYPSPLWARPEDLNNDPIVGLNQIVGHTGTKDIVIKEINDTTKHIYIDCLPFNKWHILIYK
jgi:hypothetical protein